MREVPKCRRNGRNARSSSTISKVLRNEGSEFTGLIDCGRLLFYCIRRNVDHNLQLERNLRRPHQSFARQNDLLLRQSQSLRQPKRKQVPFPLPRSTVFYTLTPKTSKRATSFGYGNKYDFTREYLRHHVANPKVPLPIPTTCLPPSALTPNSRGASASEKAGRR